MTYKILDDLPDPGAVENLGPPKRPRPPPPNPAGGGVREPDPIPRPAEAETIIQGCFMFQLPIQCGQLQHDLWLLGMRNLN